MRYIVEISFRGLTKNISEPVKTLKEAQSYRVLIDDTVVRACIVDKITGRVVEWWKD